MNNVSAQTLLYYWYYDIFRLNSPETIRDFFFIAFFFVMDSTMFRARKNNNLNLINKITLAYSKTCHISYNWISVLNHEKLRTYFKILKMVREGLNLFLMRQIVENASSDSLLFVTSPVWNISVFVSSYGWYQLEFQQSE